MTDEARLVEELVRSLDEGDSLARDQCFSAIDEKLLVSGVFSDELFSALVKAVDTPSVQQSLDACVILKIFEYNGDFLSDDQRNRLLDLLEKVFDQYKDPASCILMVELIVDLSEDRQAFERLNRLSGIRQAFPRSMFAYAMGRLLARTHDSALLNRGLPILDRLCKDSAPEVRQEAEKARLKVSRHHDRYPT